MDDDDTPPQRARPDGRSPSSRIRTSASRRRPSPRRRIPCRPAGGGGRSGAGGDLAAGVVVVSAARRVTTVVVPGVLAAGPPVRTACAPRRLPPLERPRPAGRHRPQARATRWTSRAGVAADLKAVMPGSHLTKASYHLDSATTTARQPATASFTAPDTVVRGRHLDLPARRSPSYPATTARPWSGAGR